jgi:DNA-binding response OmpR family regulator
MLAEDILADAGCTVVLAMRIGDAMRLAEEEAIDFAVLDVNLGDGATSYPVGELLEARGIPFLFASGYDTAAVDGRFAGVPRIQKPYMPASLVGTAAAVTGRG